jgi:hypothetical protein
MVGRQFPLGPARVLSRPPIRSRLRGGDPGGGAPGRPGLLQRRCAVILTTGDVQNTAAVAAADGSADTEFVIVGSTRKDYANITAVAPDDPRLAGTVTETLTRLIPS